MSSCHAWRCVTFDATGTLCRLAEPVGETYLQFWKAASGQSFSSCRHEAAVAALTSHFPTEFRQLCRHLPNFGSNGETTSAFPWWRQLVLNVMQSAQVADCLAHNEEQAERFTRDLYAHFGCPKAWLVFDDVQPTLEKLKAMEVPMAVISNFDERLEPLLEGLQLRDYFQVVTASFSQSEMKPHASIFQSTFKQLQGEEGPFVASGFLHVGDHPSKDFRAAKAIGAHAKLLWRAKHRPPPIDVERKNCIASLQEIFLEQ
ncbi:unnamed protein product [Hyaloperonospora brassicae]|uniref:Haloacid dehalogenase-like hydrolase domain-containing protein 3 n=1 Tax=Hyaloperonospora brassicae TaxID=162125 RepID=A0AAV0T1Z3_HYABA|nr:unnamed protein product [Hyaloperonospora brassicae]